MKMLLATTSLAEYWLPSLDKVNGHYPVGLGYLHSFLVEAGHEMHSLFMSSMTFPQCQMKYHQTMESFQPDVVGFNIITDSRLSAFQLMQETQNRYPTTKIVIGGVHVTAMYEQIIQVFPHVIAVLGEGELTTRELLEFLNNGGDLYEVDGIAFYDHENERVVVTPSRALVEDLDILPFPHHEIFFEGGQRTEAQVMTSRGCPFHCTFCALDALSRREVRFRSVDNVVDEIEEIQRRFPQVTSLQIYDDQFFISNKRAIAICDEIVKREIKLSIICQGRMRPVTRELVEALEKAGVEAVTLGLETGSPSVLEKCKKKITQKDALHALEMFKDARIELNVLLMIGLPGESLATITETAELVQKLQAIKFHDYSHKIQTTYIYPGTEIYRIAQKAGYIDDHYWLTNNDAPHFLLEHPEEVLILFREILLTHIAVARIFTPGGLALQKHRIGDIIKFALDKAHLYQHTEDHLYHPITRMVYGVVTGLIQEGKLSLNVFGIPEQGEDLHWLKMIPGSNQEGGQFTFSCEKVSQDQLVSAAVHFFYYHNITDATDLINNKVIDYLEEVFSSGARKQMHETLGLDQWLLGGQEFLKIL
ncbi:MAG: B12-binding domain-containing radical SAM protein [Magnetococcales bacterium]|nr:B12-binding domain-containing radical SAM protein [Magnetococcales bacterium]